MVETTTTAGEPKARRFGRFRKKEPVHIPQSVDELDAAWFTEVLSPAHDGARVVAVAHEQIGAGIGFVGELWRCRLTWEPQPPSAPSSVIVKLPTANLANRALGEGLGGYQREIDVYEKLGSQVGLPMPAFHHGAMDPDPAPWMGNVILFLFEKLPIGGVQWLTDKFLTIAQKSKRRYLLMIEDVDDARPPAQVAGGTLDDALAALEVLAKFHAGNWMIDPEPAGIVNIWPVNRAPKVFQASYRRYRDAFVEQFGESLGDDVIALLDRVQATTPAMMDHLASAPWTLLHGDFRLDNILFRSSGELVVLDYQLMGQGRPGVDVAYFITTALEPHHRDAEERLLRHYHDALRDAGVTEYEWDDLLADTSMMKDLLAHRMVGTGDVLDTTIAGSDDTFVDVMVRRVIGWVEPSTARS